MEELKSIPFGTERILAVDDEFILADVVKNSLEDMGYQVVAMTDPIETLEEFQKDPDCYDMVILDYIMPGMKGDQLAKEIIKIRSDIPIILCTGLRNPLTQKEALDIGISEILAKPVDINFMAVKVREILDRS